MKCVDLIRWAFNGAAVLKLFATRSQWRTLWIRPIRAGHFTPWHVQWLQRQGFKQTLNGLRCDGFKLKAVEGAWFFPRRQNVRQEEVARVVCICLPVESNRTERATRFIDLIPLLVFASKFSSRPVAYRAQGWNSILHVTQFNSLLTSQLSWMYYQQRHPKKKF